MTEKKNKSLVIAYGNRDREDDGAGWHILSKLAQGLELERPEFPGDAVTTSDGRITLRYEYQLTPEMAEDLSGYDRVFFLDAHNSAEMQEITFEPLTKAVELSPFSHHLTAPYLLAITKTLYGRHPEAWSLTVRGFSFQFSQNLSPSTSALVEAAAAMLIQKLAYNQQDPQQD